MLEKQVPLVDFLRSVASIQPVLVGCSDDITS